MQAGAEGPHPATRMGIGANRASSWEADMRPSRFAQQSQGGRRASGRRRQSSRKAGDRRLANDGNVSTSLTLRLALAIGIALSAESGCADTVEVIDAATKSPIADVYIVTRWEAAAFQGVQSQHRCFKVDVTRTDANGKFSSPAFSGNVDPLLHDRKRSLWFYKRGYRSAYDTPTGMTIHEIAPDSSSGLTRLRYLALARNKMNCGTAQQQKEVMLPLYEALYQEAREIGTTAEELAYVNDALFVVENLTTGNEEVAMQRYRQREREWKIKR
jgi:hypothetical protein